MSHSATILVLDAVPDDDEMEEIAWSHLEEIDCEDAEATCDIVYEAPDFMSTCEQDQINAHLRDGAACILVLYIEIPD